MKLEAQQRGADRIQKTTYERTRQPPNISYKSFGR